MKKVLFSALALSTLTACQPANISAVMRASDHENASMQTRCEKTDMRDGSDMHEVMAKYDGWRMIYLSEFTTSNRVGTSAVVCFERPKK